MTKVKHELCLINKSRLDEQNFMYRLLFKDIYWNEPNFIFYFISFTFVVIIRIEIRRGKKKERRKKNKPQHENIMVCPIT